MISKSIKGTSQQIKKEKNFFNYNIKPSQNFKLNFKIRYAQK